MKKIVFSDVDGTLLNSAHQITSLTEYAIQSLLSQNIPFVIVSGRGPTGIYPILQRYQFRCPIICYSGALILDDHRKVLFHKGMKKSTVKSIIRFIENRHFDLSWGIYSLEEWIVKDKSDLRIRREEEIIQATTMQGDVDSVTDDEINKILCICNPQKIGDIAEQIKNHFPDVCVVQSSDMLLEIMEKGITKGTAIKMLCSLWDIPLSDAIAFGDHYNDVAMLETVGRGILMGNAPDSMKERFLYQTRDHDHDGIYYGLLDLEMIVERNLSDE